MKQCVGKSDGQDVLSPANSTKAERMLSFDRKVAAASILALHEQAKYTARLSILYAARAGAELTRAKDMLPHGSFTSFREECKLGHTTATAYMALAEQLAAKLGKGADLLALPAPGDDINAAKAMVAKIEKLTDGKTLTQLYFDWDIKRDNKPTGGARPRPEKVAMTENEARAFWIRWNEEFDIYAIKKGSWQLLAPAEISAIVFQIEEALKLMKANLKSRR